MTTNLHRAAELLFAEWERRDHTGNTAVTILRNPRVVAVAAALDEAEQRGRESVGLGDFLPDPCGDETRVAYPHDYGWLRCSRCSGHEGDHEESSTGFTWSPS